MSIKQSIIDRLNAIASDAKLFKRFKEDDLGPYFSTIYYWQEVKKFSEAALDASWKVTQSARVVAEDDNLRDLGSGEHMIADSKLFSFVAKVDNPRKSFDQDGFIKLVAKRYKLDETELSKMAVNCVKETKPPLSKRILEVQK